MANFYGRQVEDCDVNIDDNELIEYVKENYNPDDVFDGEVLVEWALSNDYKLAKES